MTAHSRHHNGFRTFIRFDRNPKGPDAGRTHVLRGGSWKSRLDDVRCSTRYQDKPDDDGFPKDPERFAELSTLKNAASKDSTGFIASQKFMVRLEQQIRYYGFRCAKDASAQ